MDNITVVKRVLPHLVIEAEGNDIIIDVFLRISSIKLEATKSIRGYVEVDGFQLTLDNGEDVEILAENQRFDDCLVAAVKFHAGWTAERVLERIGEDEFAEQLALERTPEWQKSVEEAIRNAAKTVGYKQLHQ